MPAPIGNKFWMKRSTHGRHPIFPSPDALWEASLEYFEWVDKNPLYESQAFAYQGKVELKNVPKMRAMTIGGLCIFLDIERRTWDGYKEREDFIPVTQHIDQIIRDQKFSGASAGMLNANIIARDLGLADKKELSGPDGGPIQSETKIDVAKALERMSDDDLAALRAIAAKMAAPDAE